MLTKDEFEVLLNENNIWVLGRWFGPGTILRKCDPVSFDIEYNNYCHSVEDAIEEENGAELLEQALSMLNQYIQNGKEFPDAFFKVTSRYPTLKQEDLQQAYDSQ